MTKLVEWLVAAGVVGALWLSILTNRIENSLTRDHYTLVLLSPVIFVGLFGLFSLALVIYRALTFNNCDEASAELQKEIAEAKADLKRLGFKFKEATK